MKLSKHDAYVQELCDRIKPDYDSLSLNVPIRSCKRQFGEIDVVAKKDGKIDVYEVKCSHRIVKARKQLSRIKRFVRSAKNAYFYCGSSGLLLQLNI
ncbi:MAG: hypothetical protein V1702_06655 [Candidatus Woesearchaeota archaeon]